MSFVLETAPVGSTPPPSAAPAASVSVGLALQPAFADHAVQGTAILPGAFYLTAGVRLAGQAGGRPTIAIKDVAFSRPVILTPAPVALTVGLESAGPVTRCEFREAADSACATFVLEAQERPLPRRLSVADVENSLELAGEHVLDRADFYTELRRHGNHYGPCFQSVARLARAGDSAIVRFDLAQAAASSTEEIEAIAVDAAVQALMIFGLKREQAMVLRSIAAATLRPYAAPRSGWIVVTRAAASTAETVVGDAALYDSTGECWLELRGVTLALVASGAAQVTPPAAPLTVQVAATFTAEPMAEVLRFWSDKCGLALRPAFAPYGQIFQQLLLPTSALRRNREGWNVLLVNLADWQRDRTASPAAGTPASPRSFPAGVARHTLPRGLEVAHLNRHETEYVYHEIFEDRCYLRHGIRLPAGGTVVDIGANIGLFTLFVRQEAPGARVIACEPNPAAFRALQANCEAYGPGLQPLNVGVSEKRGSALFTSYEKSSVFSTFHANAAEDAHAIRAVAQNVARREVGEGAAVEQAVDELLTDRLQAQTFDCPLVSVSDLITDHQLTQIDLLKIDAEKCELEILRGIGEAHWPLIRQVVIEVHDRSRQMVQEVEQMLTRRGFHCAVVEEDLLQGSGLFNVYATREVTATSGGGSATPFSASALRRTAGELIDALAVQAHATPAQTLLVITPSDPASVDADGLAALREVEQDLLRRAASIPRVVTLGSAEILERYPAARFFQADAHQLGHIPYTADGFAALGTSIVRKISATRRPPLKVLVLDCDHTLWDGTCAEDGARGVKIGPAQRALQELALRQRAEGLLLCLCSKNQEADVWAVFAENPDMRLKREHFAAARINWEPKSANLRALAAELNVGLESLVMLDDSPVERAEIRAQCPSVGVPEWPADPAALPHFLAHCWLFDRPRTTAEDRARARMMEENRQRDTAREQAPSLASFIAGLELRVTIAAPDRGALPRVAQLTQRTNQFNLSPRPCSEAELAEYLTDRTRRCLAVRVADRFGDYGLVGAMLYHVAADALQVDAFLLSCRALGRGVEHQMLAALAREAVAAKKSWLDLALHATARNQPARDFVASLGLPPASGSKPVRLPAEAYSNFKYEPQVASATAADVSAAPARMVTVPEGPLAGQLSSALVAEIATALDDASKIAAATEAHRLAGLGFSETASLASAEPADSLRGKLLEIWRRTLGNPRIGIDDRFMEVGGTSLAAVQIVAAVRQQLNRPLSVVTFFECPTVRLLSERLSATETKSVAADDALARGARRARRLPGRATPAA